MAMWFLKISHEHSEKEETHEKNYGENQHNRNVAVPYPLFTVVGRGLCLCEPD